MREDIFQVAMEMGHKNVSTTKYYLKSQPDELKQYFPSLIPIIESMGNMPKSGTMGIKTMGTKYPNNNKLNSLTH